MFQNEETAREHGESVRRTFEDRNSAEASRAQREATAQRLAELDARTAREVGMN